jgi:hypothetical protein
MAVVCLVAVVIAGCAPRERPSPPIPNTLSMLLAGLADAAVLTEDDFGPEFEQVVDYRPEQTPGVAMDTHIVAFERDATDAAGPQSVSVGVFVARDGDMPLDVLDALLDSMTTDEGRPTPVSGPAVGSLTRWYVANRPSRGIDSELHLVLFRMGAAAAWVSATSVPGVGGQADAAEYAMIVAERLGWEPPG